MRGETVTQVALWRYNEGLGHDTIAERLNADPGKYPPPEPPGKVRARGAWGKSSVFELLKNPKYTGYQVFNRRASRSKRGKANELRARSGARRGSRPSDDMNVHPETQRTYLLRGMVFCGCGRRMFGNHRHDRAYYICWPRNNNRGRADKYEGHPKAVSGVDDRAAQARQTERERLRRAVADLAQRQDSVLRQA